MTDEDVQAWVGRQRRHTERLCPAGASRFAALLDQEVPEDLPPLWHWAYFHEPVRQAALAGDGHPRHGDFLPPVSLPQRMFAGARLRFIRSLRLDTLAERRSLVTRIEQKRGRSGPLTFVTVRHEFWDDDGVALEEEQDLVYRNRSAGQPQESSIHAAPDAPWHHVIVPDAVLLFRFSAATFNAHRIHYDAPYVTGVEGYPGLVVQGPLQALLLAELARSHGQGARLQSFLFRAVSPAFVDHPLLLRGRPHGTEAQLDCYAEGGRQLMTATAAFDRQVES